MPEDIAASPSGDAVFVAGGLYRRTDEGIPAEAYVVAYNPVTGAKLWLAKYGAAWSSYFTQVAVSPDGLTVVATGYADIHAKGPEEGLTVAYNAASGAVLWTALGPGTSYDSVAISPDGSSVFVTGSALCAAQPQNRCAQVVAYRASSGTTIWSTTSAAAESYLATELAVAPNGSAVYQLSASSFTRGKHSYQDFITTGFAAATGDTLWTASYKNFQGNSVPHAITVSPDSSQVFVTGATTLPSSKGGTLSGYKTISYDAASGATLWSRGFTGADGDGAPAGITVTPDGSTVLVTGSALGPLAIPGFDTVAYSATSGAYRWQDYYRGNGSGTDSEGGYADDIAVSPDGSTAYVTGWTYDGTTGQQIYTTIAYAASTGTRSWLVHYGNPAAFTAAAFALAVSPDGSKVFVTGQTGYDVTTVAYNSAAA